MQAVVRWNRGHAHIEKSASAVQSPAWSYIQGITPRDGKTVVLVNAMGAYETYDSNRNGDGFPARPFKVGVRAPAQSGEQNNQWRSGDTGLNGWITEEQTLPRHYHTFQTAGVFSHHANKDITKAFGRVEKPFWNDYMQRVELLLEIDNKKQPDLVQRINDGEFPAVSMGCFPAGNLVTMADGTRKPIESIAVGDLVRTHKGRGRRVTEVHKRAYKGDIHTIRAEAHEPIRCTHEHPFYAVQCDDVRKANSKGTFRWNLDAKLSPEWTHAKCLNGHMLLEPIDSEVLTPDYVTTAFARLFGYYLAEGHVLRNKQKEIVGLELSTHQDDAIHSEVLGLCASFGTKNIPVTTLRSHSASARSVQIFDARLAQLCYEHGGGYSKLKKLSAEALHWHPEFQRQMLGAYANGDGHGTKDGSLTLSTASTDLAWQLVTLLPRLGIVASIQNLTHKAGSGFSNHVTYEWVLHIGKQWAQGLRDVCAKIVLSPVLLTKNSRMIFDDYLVTPIREISSLYAEIDVYNFEVEEDESYLVAGLAVHNCRVPYDVCTKCGNRAPTRAQYCDHLKFQMNFIDEDGVLWCALNPNPFFFDISFVFRPADPTGFMMKKVAGIYVLQSDYSGEERLAAFNDKQADVRKVSDIQKIVLDGQVTGVKSVEGYPVSLMQANVESLAPATDGELDALTTVPLGDAVATLHKSGCFLSCGEFARLFMKRAGLTVRADTLDKLALLQPLVLEALAQYPDLYEKAASALFPQETRLRPELVGRIGEFVEKRGGMTEWAHQRAYEPSGMDGMNWGPQYRRNAMAPAKTDLLSMTHPDTGEVYSTTRGAAQSAESTHNTRLLGTMAVLGGAATLASGAVPGIKHLPFAARAALGVGAGYAVGRWGEGKAAPLGGSHYTSDEGVPIRASTQFVKTNAFFDKLAFDVVERLGGWPSTSLRQAMVTKCAGSPVAVLGTGDLREKVAVLFSSVERWNGDPCTPPELPLTSASDLFGRLLVR